jgi:glutathione synthase/RimK-type ligase-like ATP-grasp enzyme
MYPSQTALIKACKELKLKYEFVNSEHIGIRVFSKKKKPPAYFIYRLIPFNPLDVERICRDKDLSYSIVKKKIKVPRWKAYHDINCTNLPANAPVFRSIRAMAQDIRKKFGLPVIVKRNMGSHGNNVFLCHTFKSIIESLRSIFDKRSDQYDYMAIGQQYIDAELHIRAVATPDKLLFAHTKELDENIALEEVKEDSLLPCVYKKITDKQLLKKIQRFLAPAFKLIPLSLVGADIAIEASGKMYLIELNHTPGFDKYINDVGDEDVINTFKKLLRTHLM